MGACRQDKEEGEGASSVVVVVVVVVSWSLHVKEEGEEVRMRHGQGAVIAVASLSSHVREGFR